MLILIRVYYSIDEQEKAEILDDLNKKGEKIETSLKKWKSISSVNVSNRFEEQEQLEFEEVKNLGVLCSYITVDSKGLDRDLVQKVFKLVNKSTHDTLKNRNANFGYAYRVLIFWKTKPKIEEKKELLENMDNRRMLSSLVMLTSPFPKDYTKETVVKRTTPDLGYLERDLYLFKWHGSVIFDKEFLTPHTKDYILNDVLGVLKKMRMALFISEFLRENLEKRIRQATRNQLEKQLDKEIMNIANYRETIAKVVSLYERFKTTRLEHFNEIVKVCEVEFQLKQCQEQIVRNSQSLDIFYSNLIDLRERGFYRKLNLLIFLVAILEVILVFFEIILPYIESLQI